MLSYKFYLTVVWIEEVEVHHDSFVDVCREIVRQICLYKDADLFLL